MTANGSHKVRFTTIVLLIVCLILAVLVAWGMRFTNEDLFTALSAGRDALNGKLAQPDEWSFITNGKVWVNQNWLSGLFYYLSYAAFREWGPFLIKGALLLSCVAVLFFRCRRLGADAVATLYALVLGILSVAPFTGIRPENFGVFLCVVFTTFLTAPPSWGAWRWPCLTLTLWIWSNAHGSFLLGLVYVAAKLAVEIVRTVRKSATYWTFRGKNTGDANEIVGLISVLVLSLLLAAFGNPFGPDNLFMPFSQAGAEEWIRQNVDWQPLYRWGSVGETGPLFAPLDTWPFSFLIVLMAVMALAVAVKSRNIGNAGMEVRGDLLMEVVIFLAAAVLSFRFRRLIPFAGMLAIPLLAYMIRSCLAPRADHAVTSASGFTARLAGFLQIAIGVTFSIFLTWMFCAKTLLPHLPGNPMLPDMPLAAQHMRWNAIFQNVVHFLQANRMPARVFSGWSFSDFLIFHVPKIQMFVCGRAQTIYSNENLRDYLSIVRTQPRDRTSADATLRLLDDFRVELVVLPDTGDYGGLTDVLMASRKWIGVYADSHAVVLVKNDPHVIRQVGNGLGLSSLRYPDHRTAVVGRTLVSLGVQEKMEAAWRSELESLAKQRPDSSLYWLIGNGNRDGRGCLDSESRGFLLSQLHLLLRTSFMTADGANSVLKSVIEIASILEHDSKSCPTGARMADFGSIADQYTALFQKTCREFLP